MPLPPSDFADAFLASAVPRLRQMVESRGLFVSLGLDEFPDALNEIRAEGIRLGASYLPKGYLDRFLDWTGSALLTAIDAADRRVAVIEAEIRGERG